MCRGAGDDAVGGIEADPAQPGQERLDPRVGGPFGRAIVVQLVVIEIAADVAARESAARERPRS